MADDPAGPKMADDPAGPKVTDDPAGPKVADDPTGPQKSGWRTIVVTAILTSVVTTAVGAFLAFSSNLAKNGWIIRQLGGLSVSQIKPLPPFADGHANCGNQEPPVPLSEAKTSFCFLTDISIRVGNSIARPQNEGGWEVCKIELGTGANAGRFMLSAKMDGVCPGKEPKDKPEITCKAKCIQFAE
jgi:hypothetical protein